MSRIAWLRHKVPAFTVAAVLVLPILWWLKVAFVSPETEMLVPSSCGQWVVHPHWDIDLSALDFKSESPDVLQKTPPVVYRLEVPTTALAEGAVAELTVMGAARVLLGKRLCAELRPDRGWKRSVDVDLTKCVGGNPGPAPSVPLLIHAQNVGPAPARVCWQPAAAELPATGTEGWNAWTPKAGWSPAAQAGREMSELLDKDFHWPSGPWGYRVLLAGLVLLALVGLLRSSGASRCHHDSSGGSPRAGRAAVWLVLALVLVVYGWNGLVYPWQVSRLDAPAHVERLTAAAEGNLLPPADSMYQGYQPPLYYALGGWLVSITHPDLELSRTEIDPGSMRPVQVLDALSGIANAFLVWWVLARFGPASTRARVLALAVALLSPVAVTTHPMLGNESFAGVVCGAALVAGLVWLPRNHLGLAVLAGTLAGLALLAKYTGLMPIAAVGLVVAAGWLFRPPASNAPETETAPREEPDTNSAAAAPRRQRLAPVVAWGVPIILLAGPFYFGRWLNWGNPFVGNWSTQLGYAFEFEPGYRTLDFFFRFGEVFLHAPERGMWSSLWDGLYVSTWGEVNDSFLPIRDDAVNAVQLVVLALAVVPTLAWFAGLLESIGRALRERPGVDLGFVAVTSFTVASVTVFTTRVPFITTVKAIFLLSLLIPAAYFAAHGYARMERGLGRARWLLDLVTVVQILLVLRLFLWLS